MRCSRTLTIFTTVILGGHILMSCGGKTSPTSSGVVGGPNEPTSEIELSGTMSDEAPVDFVQSSNSVSVGQVNLTDATSYVVKAYSLEPSGSKKEIFKGSFAEPKFSFKSTVARQYMLIEITRLPDGGQYGAVLPPPTSNKQASLVVDGATTIASKMAALIASKAESGDQGAQQALTSGSVSVADLLMVAQSVRTTVIEQKAQNKGSAIDLKNLTANLISKSNELIAKLTAEGQFSAAVAEKLSQASYQTIFGDDAKVASAGILAYRVNPDLGSSEAAKTTIAYAAIKASSSDTIKAVDEAFRTESTAYRTAPSVAAAVAAKTGVVSDFKKVFSSCMASPSNCAQNGYTPPRPPESVLEQIKAPGAPTSVTGIAGDGQVSLTWNAPASDGGTSITDYIIQYSSDKGSSWSAFPVSKSISLSIAVTGLSSCKGYVFRIAAKNSVGTGSYSTQSSPVVLKNTCGLFEGVSTSYSVQPNFVQGWALNFQDASRPAQVELRIDNTVVGTMNTGRSRMDVVTYFQNTFNIPVNANSGYSFQIPDSYLDSRPHTVSVFAVSSQGVKTELGQSPRTFTFFRLREILAQPVVDTLTTNLLTKPWWNPGRPNVPFGYAFIPDYPGQVPPDKTFYVTINNPTSEFKPPATRAQEAFFSNDLFSTTGFSSVNPLKSQFSLSQVDFNNFSLNGVQVEKNRIGFWSSTRSFLPSCSPDLAGNCTQKGQFVMAASYNFGLFENSWSRPKPWQTGVSEGVIVSVDLKVPKALATNDINQDGSWKSAAFVNANFLLRDIKTDKKFWYSQSIFDCRGAVPNFLLDLVMQDECPNGLCLGIPVILSSIARQRTDTRRFSRTLSESTLYPIGTWNDSYRSFSYEINASHLNQALTEIRLRDSSWSNTVAKDIEIEHFNFSPELSRGTSDNAEIGMSFQNLRVHEVLSACQPGQISAPLTCNTMVLINHQWVWKLGTQTRTCSSNGRWEPPTNCQ